MSLRCQSNGKLLTSFNGRRAVGCTRRNIGPQQKFRVESIGQDDSSIAILCSSDLYLSSENGNFSILDDLGVPAPNVAGVVFIPGDKEAFDADLKPATTGGDACVVKRYDDSQPPSYPVPATPDAGEVVILSSPSGTYAELYRLPEGRQVEPFFRYMLPEGIDATRPVPDALVLDIPGGEVVPALSGLRFPDVDTLQLLEPAPARNIQVTPETIYRWVPGSNPDATVEISVSTDDLYFNCSARDDGEFVVPQDTIADVGSQFVGTFSRIMRVASSIAYREGSVAFKLSRSSGYNAFNNNNNLDYFP